MGGVRVVSYQIFRQSFEAEYEGNTFYDFCYANQTSYYDVTRDLSFLESGIENNGEPFSSYITSSSSGTITTAARVSAVLGDLSGAAERAARATVEVDSAGAPRVASEIDEATADYVGVYTEDVILGRATRVSQSQLAC